MRVPAQDNVMTMSMQHEVNNIFDFKKPMSYFRAFASVTEEIGINI